MIKIETKGINTLVKKFDELSKEGKVAVQSALNDWADRTSRDAIKLAPADESNLRASIHPNYGNGSASVTATAKYAAYIEFGTRKYATAYVSSLPQDWATYAATFKGPSGGTFKEFVQTLMAWGERTGKLDPKYAYVTALKILRDGIKPQPFLYPSVIKNTPQLIQDIKDIYS
jgi:HK97 gp10 family phage protein